MKDLNTWLKDTLGERVKDVRTTDRLTSSPACLVADEHDLSGNLSRILKSAGQKIPGSKPILEINPTHALVQRYLWLLAHDAEPERIAAMVMNIGEFRDAVRLSETVGDDILRLILRLAEAGQFNQRSWHYWH